MQIHGDCDVAFYELIKAFEENFSEGKEIGAALSIYVAGKPVVDLWAGMANKREAIPWKKNTLVNVFSTTKGITAICVHRLVQDGLIDLDKPVAFYWPEFGANGKESIPVQWLLSHKAGVTGVRHALSSDALYDWDTMCDALAAEEVWWPVGEKHGYHAVTFGWLLGEVVRRVTGKTVGDFFRETFAEPLELDFHIGLKEQEHHRVARLKPASVSDSVTGKPGILQRVLSDPDGITARAFANPFNIFTDGNKKEWRTAEIPSANGHGTARSIAKLYGILANGGSHEKFQVLDKDGIARCYTEQSFGWDEVLGMNTRFSLGFMLSQHDREGAGYGSGVRSFGHPGAGGSVGFADPDARVGFAYVPNRLGSNVLLDPRATRLIKALYQCL